MIPLTKKCKTKSEKTDEGVSRGDGPTPPDPGGELVEDPLHLRAQDQEAPRVLGEAQSRVSLIERRGKRSQIVFLHWLRPGVARLWEDLCLEESI